MDDLHSVGTNGNPIDMFSCNGTPVQNWAFEPDGTIRVYGSKCVTVRTLGRVGAKVQLWTCTAANRKGQQWAIVRTGDVSSELSIGGLCLAVPSMTAANGSQLVMARCTLRTRASTGAPGRARRRYGYGPINSRTRKRRAV